MTPISEASFLQQVKSLAYLHGWAFHHATPSLTSKGKWITTGAPGFPDVVLAHRARGLIFAELKTAKGKPTDSQLDWMARIGPYAECYLWRPDDLKDIERRLSQC
jgi:hypothetical protein